MHITLHIAIADCLANGMTQGVGLLHIAMRESNADQRGRRLQNIVSPTGFG